MAYMGSDNGSDMGSDNGNYMARIMVLHGSDNGTYMGSDNGTGAGDTAVTVTNYYAVVKYDDPNVEPMVMYNGMTLYNNDLGLSKPHSGQNEPFPNALGKNVISHDLTVTDNGAVTISVDKVQDGWVTHL